jgi:hypothetical protein
MVGGMMEKSIRIRGIQDEWKHCVLFGLKEGEI